jgi:hypothetical protein
MKPAISTDNACDRARELAVSLDFLTEEDVCALFAITPATAETWRKTRRGPTYALAGNRPLYPREAVRDFLRSQVKERATPAKALL